MSDQSPQAPIHTSPSRRTDGLLVDTRGLSDEPPPTVDTTPPEPDEKVSFDDVESMARTELRDVNLGGVTYRGAAQIPARMLPELIKQQADLANKATAEGDETDPEEAAERIESAIGILDFFVLDEDLVKINERTLDKSNPIGLPEIISEIGRLLPGYIGKNTGKASG